MFLGLWPHYSLSVSFFSVCLCVPPFSYKSRWFRTLSNPVQSHLTYSHMEGPAEVLSGGEGCVELLFSLRSPPPSPLQLSLLHPPPPLDRLLTFHPAVCSRSFYQVPDTHANLKPTFSLKMSSVTKHESSFWRGAKRGVSEAHACFLMCAFPMNVFTELSSLGWGALFPLMRLNLPCGVHLQGLSGKPPPETRLWSTQKRGGAKPLGHLCPSE